MRHSKNIYYAKFQMYKTQKLRDYKNILRFVEPFNIKLQ